MSLSSSTDSIMHSKQISHPMTETIKTRRHNKAKTIQAENQAGRVPLWRALIGLFSSWKDHQGNKKKTRKGLASLCSSMRYSSNVIRPVATAPEANYNNRWSSLNSCNTCRRSLEAYQIDGNGAVPSSLSSNSSTVSTLSSSTLGGSFREMHVRRFSAACYECVDTSTGCSRISSMRTNICHCSDCGDIFVKPEDLELHQAVSHAVYELGQEDSSRNIIVIIFQSSWFKKQAPQCKIDRVLKVNNTLKTITSYEDYRDSIMSKAGKEAKKHPRCIADGNEILRFYCTTLACLLGLDGSTKLCQTVPYCSICNILRNGFKADELGRIKTMATSLGAHNIAQIPSDKTKAMVVCRVIAGRVNKSQDTLDEYDSMAGTYSSLDELFVFNSKAILPCFVVIYQSL